MSNTDLFHHIIKNNTRCTRGDFVHLNKADKEEYAVMNSVQLEMQLVVWKCLRCGGFYYEL